MKNDKFLDNNLSGKDLNEIVDIFTIYSKKSFANKKLVEEYIQNWFNTVIDFLVMRGYDIIPPELKNAEVALIDRGLSLEYIAALLRMLPTVDRSDEAERIVTILSATSEDRQEAIKQIYLK